jgi:enediyne biosynthesis protein E4
MSQQILISIIISMLWCSCDHQNSTSIPSNNMEESSENLDMGTLTEFNDQEVNDQEVNDSDLVNDFASLIDQSITHDQSITNDLDQEIEVDMEIIIDPPLDEACNTAAQSLGNDEGFTVLKWDDGMGVTGVHEQTWQIAGEIINQADLYEGVRFELEHPGKIHQIQVQYASLPAPYNFELPIGLYADFGYNGFDFWTAEPLWTGSRCRGDTEVAQWLTFTLDPPLEVDHPGLFYVAQHREYTDDPAFLFDVTEPERCQSSPDDCCSIFNECHSTWNFPRIRNLQGTSFWAGLSTSFRYDYMVRMVVEYDEQISEDDLLFEEVDLPSTGSRSAWGDYDQDGDDDLITGGTTLYQNQGDGTWLDVSDLSGISALAMGGSGVWGDYDNDGCLDLIIFEETYQQGERLLRNDCQGGFEDQTQYAGLDDLQTLVSCDAESESEHAPSAAAAWVDLDQDGYLDLFVSNFLCWGSGEAYQNHIWHNMGDGTFESWTGTRGFEVSTDRAWASRGISPIDYDQDGDMDLFVNNYRLNPNRFYENQGDGTFVMRAMDIGLAGKPSQQSVNAYYGHSIGVAWGDLNHDMRWDVVVGNLAHPRFFDFSNKSQVLLQDEEGYFTDIHNQDTQRQGEAGLHYQETHSVPLLADFDHNGTLDLIMTAVYDGRPTDFYWGQGDGTFILDRYTTGLKQTNGWGLSASDFDHDGDLDVIYNQGKLYRNRLLAQSETPTHWVQLQVIGNVTSNFYALGSTVHVHAGDQSWIRYIDGGSGQGGQNSSTIHFGLGEINSIDWIEVQFIGGEIVRYDGPFMVDQKWWLLESGITVAGWDWPNLP